MHAVWIHHILHQQQLFFFFFFAILPELINLEFQVLLVHAVCRHINKQQIILFLLRPPKKLETYSATFPTHWINKLCPWVLIDKPVQILPAIHVQSACVGFPPTVQSQACYINCGVDPQLRKRMDAFPAMRLKLIHTHILPIHPSNQPQTQNKDCMHYVSQHIINPSYTYMQ